MLLIADVKIAVKVPVTPIDDSTKHELRAKLTA